MRSILGDIEENVNDDSLNILYKLYDRIFDYHNYTFDVKIVNTIKSIYCNCTPVNLPEIIVAHLMDNIEAALVNYCIDDLCINYEISADEMMSIYDWCFHDFEPENKHNRNRIHLTRKIKNEFSDMMRKYYEDKVRDRLDKNYY